MEWTPEREAKLREMVSDGYTPSQIAAAIGMGRNQVSGKMHRLRHPVDPRGNQRRVRAPKAVAPVVQPAPAAPVAEGMQRLHDAVAHSVAAHGPAIIAASQRIMAASADAVRQINAQVQAILAARRPAPGQGCRFPLWGDGKPTHRYCDQPRRMGRDGAPNSAYCPACHAVAHLGPGAQRLEQYRLRRDVGQAFARAVQR